MLNTNLCTAVAMLVWIAWDYIFREKPSMIGAVNGMITGLVAITPGAGFMNGYGAIIVGVVASTLVWMSIRFLSRAPMFRHVDDTLGVIYTHGIAGLLGGLMVGLLANSGMIEYFGVNGASNIPGFSGVLVSGSWTLLRWQAETAAWVIGYTAIATFVILKLIGDLRACGSRRGAGDRRSRDPATRSAIRRPHGSEARTRPPGSRAAPRRPRRMYRTPKALPCRGAHRRPATGRRQPDFRAGGPTRGRQPEAR